VGVVHLALLHPVSIGLVSALLIALALTVWFFAQATLQSAREREARAIVLQAAGLAQLVTAHVRSGSDDAALEALVRGWSAAATESHARVVRLSGARLLASTFPADGEQPRPRRLSSEEKALFDLGQELRAAVETNRSEGVLRKRQLLFERAGESRARVAVPLFLDEAVIGFTQIEVPSPTVELQLHLGDAVSFLIVPWLILLCAIALLAGRELPPRRKPWLLTVIALAAFVASCGLFARGAAANLEAAFFKDSAHVGELFLAARERLQSLASSQGLQLDLDSAVDRWDVDAFQRPLGLLTPGGEVSEGAVRARVQARFVELRRATLGNVILGAAVLLLVALGFGRRLRETIMAYRYAYGYVAPAMIGMLVLVFFPFIYGITLSFTGQTILNVNEPITELWVGLQNYAGVLGDFSVARHSDTGWLVNYQNFYWTLGVTVLWTISNVTVGVSLGMLLALALNTPGLRGKAIYRVLLILPWAMPNYITALIWKGLFHPQFGAINQAIQMFGGAPVAWFDSVAAAFLTGLATNGWLSFPFMMVVILGGLQSISHDMYEAATVEGASRWQQFWRITLPLLKPTLIPAIVLSVVWTFNMFNVIYLVSGGAPAGANEILITKSYKIAFEEYRYGYAAAYSVVIFLILLVYGVFQTRITRATEAAHT
jgi:arabinogalactan oligomer/maltooligosaccharide transport system permease protein